MLGSKVFERFLNEAPICVMARATLEKVFAAEDLDALFHRNAQQQYERELLFSTIVLGLCFLAIEVGLRIVLSITVGPHLLLYGITAGHQTVTNRKDWGEDTVNIHDGRSFDELRVMLIT